jgi:threonine dehydratase
MVSSEEIALARNRILPYIRRTPILPWSRSGSADGGIFLKLEQLQVTRSFKPRGAFNKILSSPSPISKVITASGGNAGLAVAYAAHELGIPAEIFVPATVSPVKLRRISAFKATPIVGGDSYAAAYTASQARAAETSALFVHAYDQPEIVAGQGTVAMEIVEQLDDVDTVIVAVGGGGLYAGIASWLPSSVKVVPVEPVNCPTMRDALINGAPTDVQVSGVAADSLGARRIGEYAFAEATSRAEQPIMVSDPEIMQARQVLWDEAGILVEPGGAVAFAAVHSNAYVPSTDERVCVVLCGANTDPRDLA